MRHWRNDDKGAYETRRLTITDLQDVSEKADTYYTILKCQIDCRQYRCHLRWSSLDIFGYYVILNFNNSRWKPSYS